MARPPIGTFLPVSAFLAAAALSGCFGDDPKGTEVENELGVGRIYRADGKPAPHAEVRIYSVGEVPGAGTGGSVLSTRTDGEGRFRVSKLDAGEFNILAELDGHYAYQDSLSLSDDAGPIPPDTLEEPGRVRGWIAMQPQHDPSSATVQLLGTDRFANVSKSGQFEFADMAGGEYSLRVVTTVENYTPTFASLRVVPGVEVSLADTIRLIFTGVPIAEGLEASYDTLAGIATVRWKASDLPQLQDYLIYRDPGFDAAPASAFLAATRDTVFRDTLWRPESPIGAYPSAARPHSDTASRLPFTYRIRLRTLTQEIGPFYRRASVRTVSPYWVTTRQTFRLAGKYPDIATVGDSLTLVFAYSNPTRSIRWVAWNSDPGEPAFRVRDRDERAGADTLRLAAGDRPGRHFFLAATVDDAGARLRSQIEVRVVDDRPRAGLLLGADPSPDTVYRNFGDTLRIGSTSTDTGIVTKREWFIGTGSPVFSPGGADTALVLEGYSPGAAVTCAFRAADEDGNLDTAHLVIRMLPWRSLPPLPTPRMEHTVEVIGGKIYAIGGLARFQSFWYPSRSVEMFDPATRTWVVKSPMAVERVGHSSIVVNGEIMVAGGWGSRDMVTLEEVEFYNPATDTWRAGPRMTQKRAYGGLVKQGSKIVTFEGETRNATNRGVYMTNNCEAYDTVAAAWEPCYVLNSLPSYRPRARFLTASVNGTIYALGGVTQDAPLPQYGVNVEQELDQRDPTGLNFLFDFNSHSLSEWPRTLPFRFHSRASAVHGDWILMAGGAREEAGAATFDRFEALNPQTGELRDLSRIYPPRGYAAAAMVDGNLYLIGGGSRNPFEFQGTTQVFVPSLDSLLPGP